MSDVNRVTLSGRLAADPELKYLPSGTAVANLRLASNRTYTSNGERREEALFVDVEVYLRKNTWERDGQRHSRLLVVADQVSFGPSVGAAGATEAAAVAGGDEKDDLPF